MGKQSNYQLVKEMLSSPSDLKKRTVFFADKQVDIIYIAELCDSMKIYESIVGSINQYNAKPQSPLDEFLMEEVLSAQEVKECADVNTAVQDLLKGFAVVSVQDKMLSVDCELITTRAITEPPTGTVVKGPREGFVESCKVNLSLIRKRLATPDLKMQMCTVGELTQTSVFVMHIDKIADDKVVQEVVEKVKSLKMDGVIDSSYIAKHLSKHKHSMFKQVGMTEKPDVIVSKLLEGRVAIVVDGSPFVLTVPFMLMEELQNSQDYYTSNVHGTFLRILRFIGVVMSVLLPGLYVSLQLYHYKILPLDFLTSVLNSTQSIPFTPFSEVIFVIILFEILYDASLRMPRHLGLALSIVGALILGDTAVQAGLVSPPAVVLVALSGLTFYTIPGQAEQLSELRLIFVFAGGVLGLFGLILMGMFLLAYLCDFDSYGGTYLAPYAPQIPADMKDSLVMKGLSSMKKRPYSVNKKSKNRVRIK